MNDTAELYIGIKIEGEDVDVAELEAFLKATKQLDFPALLALWNKMTSVTWTEIKKSSQAIITVSEVILYPK